MSGSCGSGGCSSCGVSDCSARNSQGMQQPFDFTVRLNKDSSVKRVIGVMSGKGGVGKSFVTSMLAVKSRAKGLSTAILDADITGPSIPKAFGISGKVFATDDGAMIPSYSNTGITVISSNLLLDNPTDHLDLESITSLNKSLERFNGTILFTTHDHEFIQTIANKIIEITPKGILEKEMEYDDYLNDETVETRLNEMYS